MKAYRTKSGKIPGTSLDEVVKIARHQYHLIQKRTPRRTAYVRSKYFTKDKIFINTFWAHLNQKSPKKRIERLKLYSCAIELIRNSNLTPDTIYKTEDKSHSFHRFYGVTSNNEPFCVQIKENKRSNRKDFMSVFPIKKIK